MRNTILFLILIVSNTLSAQTFEWAKTFGGAINDGAYSTKVDSAGNIYTSGFFGGTVDFDPGPGLNNRTSVGGFDVFVTKMGPLGNFIWARTFGGNSTDEGYSLDVDPAGNVYTTGSFKGSVDFDPGSGTFILYSANYSVFVQKLDSSGNFLWAKTFGGPNHDEGVDISVDAYGNAFTTGLFSGTVDFDPGPGVSSITSSNTSMFIQKLDASGNFLWAKSTVGNIVERGYGVCVDGASNVYITGTFLGVADFDPGAGTAFLSSTGYCVYVQKLDSSGNFLWAKSFGESTQSWGWAIDVDYSGNVYTTGYFENTADFDPGPGTFLMTALD
ncbi:MAG: SBBP repeat-containing protein, partial [Bacteroidota bacterium]